ncbi:MAG: pyrimidine dimer DNA glycosylase/endonuclease V [Nitrosomonas sp.]
MRIWSIHPKYLDSKGLVALWRETLLAQKVLCNQTKGYQNHPQLLRFRSTENPLELIGFYLCHVAKEADRRGYSFDKTKINITLDSMPTIPVTNKQVCHEFSHLLNKLKVRNRALFENIKALKKIQLHPLFHEVSGEIENWEILH